MKGWKEISLKEICKTQYGYTASATEVDTGVKFVRITDIVPDFVDWNSVPFCGISEKDFQKYKLNENDLVVARTGATVGFAKQIRKGSPNAVFASYLVKLIPSDKADKKFLGILIESNIYKEFIQAIAGGSAQPNANANDLTLFKFRIPPLPIQQRIASMLSAYDDLIEVNNQRIKLLEQTARELYKEWFVRMRFPGYKQAKFKKGVPEGWTTIAISDVVDFKMGQSPKSEFYNEEGIGLPFHQGVGNYGLRFPVHKVFCSVNGRTANEGDVLFSVRAPVGRLNIADRKLIIGRGLAALRHKKGLNSYLFYLLQNEFSKEDLIGNGSIFNSVGKDELRKFKIFDVGDLALNFNNLVKPIDEQLLILIQQNTQLRQIRDRLLPRLVSGKLQLSEL